MKPPTEMQLCMAQIHQIPSSQAHTINIQKALAYLKWKNCPECRLNDFLDREFNLRELRKKAEYI